MAAPANRNGARKIVSANAAISKQNVQAIRSGIQFSVSVHVKASHRMASVRHQSSMTTWLVIAAAMVDQIHVQEINYGTAKNVNANVQIRSVTVREIESGMTINALADVMQRSQRTDAQTDPNGIH